MYSSTQENLVATMVHDTNNFGKDWVSLISDNETSP